MEHKSQQDQKELFPAYLFHQGTNYKAYQMMGAHWLDETTAEFYVWAPNAQAVAVVGDFNNWDGQEDPMERVNEQGLWHAVVTGVREFDSYKYLITAADGRKLHKADPYAFHTETRPGTASKLYRLGQYQWKDDAWRQSRDAGAHFRQPMNIYEVHLGSWKTYEDGNHFNYRKLAEELVPYVKEMGYTHIEIMPVTEYPFDGSWGYQVTGYFAPTSRYGKPEDFMAFVDLCHQQGVGVIMDWVPAHFPKDESGLYEFDGGFCYEYADARKREHYEWGTRAFDYGRCEVISFLVSSAMFWVEEYHIDGIRVDAVASMLYLDYGRQDGQWMPNIHGGKENLEAVALLRKLNSAILTEHPGVLMIAEESTAWPMVTKPDYVGGLGFTYKWNMGWMNDVLRYMSMDPYFRSYNHDKLTFSMVYAFSENFILPISHDEVVHGKGSLINKMPGSYEQKFAGLRAFLGYMMSSPGKKLLFMGSEFGQFIEWDYQKQLDWMLLQYDSHRQMKDFTRDVNHFYLDNPAFWQIEDSWDGYRWLNADDNSHNVLAYLRMDEKGEQVMVVCNFAPVPWDNYIVGVPDDCSSIYEVFSSDDVRYGGSGVTNGTRIMSRKGSCGEYKRVVTLKLAPLSTVYFKLRKRKTVKPEKAAGSSTASKKAKESGARKGKTASAAKASGRKKKESI